MKFFRTVLKCPKHPKSINLSLFILSGIYLDVKRKDGFWKISSIPFEIRNQPNRFKIKYGEVFREYAKVSFDKEKAFHGQAEFVASLSF
jgi:hypothetical protein